MLYETKIPSSYRTEFVAKVKNISDKLGIMPEWLMLVMNSESGINSKAVNKQAGDSNDDYTRAAKRATGLIQFMPPTSIGLGTTNQKLYNMSPIEQLDWVYKFYNQSFIRGKYRSFYDLYLATFYPVALGKPDDWVIGKQISPENAIAIYNQNPAIAKFSDLPNMINIEAFRKYTDAKLKGKGIDEADLAVLRKSGEVLSSVKGTKKIVNIAVISLGILIITGSITFLIISLRK